MDATSEDSAGRALARRADAGGFARVRRRRGRIKPKIWIRLKVTMADGQSDNDARTATADTDWSGRRRLAANVLSSWAGHLVFIVSGFVMPRLIDGEIGQDALGVWDFAWSLIAYFGLVQGGVVSSVNRFVARYRAVNDVEGVNRAVSTVTVILVVMGLAVIGLTAGLGRPDYAYVQRASGGLRCRRAAGRAVFGRQFGDSDRVLPATAEC